MTASSLELVKTIYKFPDFKERLDLQPAFEFTCDLSKGYHDVNLRNCLEGVLTIHGARIYPIKNKDLVSSKSTSNERLLKMMRQRKVGELYVMRLKQSSEKQTSAYPCAPVGRTGTPEKTDRLSLLNSVSESLIEPREYSRLLIMEVRLRKNETLLNLFGGDNEYKTFPDIGEHTKGNILCVKRGVLGDEHIYYAEGEVLDVSITNSTFVQKEGWSEQLLHYSDMMREFCIETREFAKELIKSGKNCSQSIVNLAETMKNVCNARYSDRNMGDDDECIIHFIIKKTIDDM